MYIHVRARSAITDHAYLLSSRPLITLYSVCVYRIQYSLAAARVVVRVPTCGRYKMLQVPILLLRSVVIFRPQSSVPCTPHKEAS